MVVDEMMAQECRAMLARTNVARLACAHDNQPYIVPIHVDLDHEFLYGLATQGQKIEWMRHNPRVCLEVDEFSPQQWATVVVFGHYEELPHQVEYEDWRRIALQLFQRHPVWWQPATVPLTGHEQRAPVAFRIRIDRLTGRRGSNDAGKARIEKNPMNARRPGWLAGLVRGVLGAPRPGPIYRR
jgi:nitroimidazol reductase NimA-like FMN-containing flavoprotein (pyridoxamine 5'-phosphate oxidase superfamily)